MTSANSFRASDLRHGEQMPTVLLWLLVMTLFVLGLVGTVVPILPGIALVYGGVVLYAAVTGFREVSLWTTLGFGAVALLTWLATLIGPAAAAGRAGGRGKTVVGTVIGMLLGLFTFGPLGLVTGAFLGALAGALVEGRSLDQAAGVAAQSILGAFAASVVQFLLALVLIGAFFIAVLF